MKQLSRRISPFTLFMLSMNAIIGSGWLFAPFYAAKVAGAAAILSWVIGGFAAILIAFTFAELSAMLPIAGGTAHIPQLSHGAFVSFILSWVAWITALMMAPIEVQAVLQYASLFYPKLIHMVGDTPQLSFIGFCWAAILMMLLCFINIFSYQGLMRFNFVLFLFKIFVMCLTVVVIISTRFTPHNFSGILESTRSVAGWQAILSAVATGGIVLAFNGFKSGVELAGEAKRLSISIPLSTVGSVVSCLVLYLGLQICFIGALDSSAIAKGWHYLSFTGDAGPFVGLAGALGLFMLLKLLYVNAVISPLGAGLIYVTSTARILYAMSKIGYVPRFLSQLNHQRFPVWAIVVNFALGMISFLPLPGWQSMVNFLVSAMVITYAMGPIALICFRLSMPEKSRPFRLPVANIFCLLAFYCCNLFSYWTGWSTISKLGLMLLIGIVLFFVAYFRGIIQLGKDEWKSSHWVIPYLSGLVLISYLGAFGGKNIIPFGLDFLVIAVFTVGVFYAAVRSRLGLNANEVTQYLISEAMAPEHG